MFIVQFSKDGERFRTISKALFDAYSVGDRLMEGVEFEVIVTDGSLAVKATPRAACYIESFEGSIEKWERRVFDAVKDGEDTLFLDKTDEGWDNQGLHLTDDLSFYLEDGLKQEI